MGLRAGLNATAKRKKTSPADAGNRNPHVQPVVTIPTDPPPDNFVFIFETSS